MPKKTTKKMARKIKVAKIVTKQNFLSRLEFKESYLSLFLGFFVVVIIAVISLSFLKLDSFQRNLEMETSSTRTELSVPSVISILPEKYTVREGDDLWSISEKIYKSGYNWTDIAKANKISNPGLIFVGQVLEIPNVEPIMPDEEIAPQAITTQVEGAIFSDTYEVTKGDNLWNIAVRAYGDGFKWVGIAKVNSLSNPDLIFSGNVLKLPR